MAHPIEEGPAYATFDLLVGLATRLERAADEMLIAIDERFGQRASMIAPFLFPALASRSSHGSQDFIVRQRGRLTIAMLLDCSVFAPRDDRLNPRAARWRGQRVEPLLFILGPIAAYHRHRLIDWGQQIDDLRSIIDPMGRQRLRDHLAGSLVDPTGSLRHVRRFVQPCWRTLHSPSP